MARKRGVPTFTDKVNRAAYKLACAASRSLGTEFVGTGKNWEWEYNDKDGEPLINVRILFPKRKKKQK